MVDDGRFPEARVRVTQFVFGPPVRYPVLFRVVGSDLVEIRRIATEVRDVMADNANLRLVHLDWSDRTPNLHVALDQERLRLIGLTPKDAALQLATVFNGTPATQVREGQRIVDVLVRAPSAERHGLRDIDDVTLTTADGRSVPLSQVGHLDTRTENAVLKRYDRETYIAVEGDVVDGKQPPDVTAEILPKLEAIKARLPAGYRIDTGGSVEESKKADVALGAVFPLMLIVMLTVIMLQVRSFSMMGMVLLTAPLGLVGAVPTLLIFHQPFGFNAILGLIGLAGILMRNTLILVDQIHHDRVAGLSTHDAVVESTVRRARPVVLTAAAAMLAFIPLTHSTFWGSLAYVLVGGVGVGTLLTLLFLPALYAIWFRVPHASPATPTDQPAPSLRSNVARRRPVMRTATSAPSTQGAQRLVALRPFTVADRAIDSISGRARRKRRAVERTLHQHDARRPRKRDDRPHQPALPGHPIPSPARSGLPRRADAMSASAAPT